MPSIRIPLIGVTNPRGIDGTESLVAEKDQQFKNVVFDIVKNSVTGKSVGFVERRPGWKQQAVVSAGNASSGLIRTDSIGSVVSAFGTTNSTLYDSTTNIGTITGVALHFKETTVSNVGCILIRSSDGTGWYYMAGARDVTTYTCDGNNSTTITDIKIAGANSTAGLYPGQKLTAASNIAAGSRIVSVDPVAFTAVLDTATTGGAFNDLSTTKEPIAKITSGAFVTTGTNISGFECMDGYAFYASEDGYVYHSDANSVANWTAGNKIAANSSPDLPLAIARQQEKILCFGNASIDPFYNAGNPTGSVLSKWGTPQRIGALNQRSMTYLGDDIYFVKSTREGDVQVMRMRALQCVPVSTPQIDRIIGTANAAGSAVYLSGFHLGGYAYVIVNVLSSATITTNSLLQTEDDFNLLLETGDKIIIDSDSSTTSGLSRCLLYNADLNIWHEWDSTLPTYVTGLGEGSINQIICSSRIATDGKIYTINPSADNALYQDDGTTYSTVIRTSQIDHGTDERKFIGKISLIADTEPAGTVTLECSDDGYATWQTLGEFDLTEARKDIHRCGSYIGGRAYRLTHAYNGHFRASSLDIQYEVGS